MVLHGTVPLAYGFDCIEQVQFSGSLASVHIYYGYSVNSIFAKRSCVSCTQFHLSFNSKKSVCWNSTRSSNPCSPGLRCQIHPMIPRKEKTGLQDLHHCFHISGVERRRLITVRASVAESSIKDLGNEEIPVESGKEDNAYEDPLPYGLYPYLMPKHVAVIMDGNSRWAEQRGLPSTEGHRAGRIALTEVVKLSCKWGIKILTVFAFSTDNWLRPKTEVMYLMDLFQFVLEDELETLMRTFCSRDLQEIDSGDSLQTQKYMIDCWKLKSPTVADCCSVWVVVINLWTKHAFIIEVRNASLVVVLWTSLKNKCLG